jgi:hypothetical protein
MIVLKGCKADYVSREQIRAFLYATLMVLSYHNRAPALPLVVTIKRRMKDLGNCCGSRIDLRADLQPEEMLTTCVHEVIHACISFPAGQVEKCTTTLCSKIKTDVLRIADVLLEGTYRRAAYIAHTRIHYPPKGDDFYDPDEDIPVGVVTRYGGKKSLIGDES